MCSMEKVNIVSCQITYFPIDSKYYLNEIDQVLELIKESGLEYNIGGMSTTISGESERVFTLISNIHRKATDKSCNYTMNIMISNICGCKAK